MKIFIGNLDQDVDQGKLLELFQNYGEIVSFDVFTDRVNGDWKTYAFVDVKNDEDAETILREVNLSKILGKKIDFHKARWRIDDRRGPERKGGRRYDDE